MEENIFAKIVGSASDSNKDQFSDAKTSGAWNIKEIKEAAAKIDFSDSDYVVLAPGKKD